MIPLLEIVIATGNPHKVAEIDAIFRACSLDHVRVRSLAELAGGPFEEPNEIGATFEANATIKALAYAGMTGRLCLADDSGLEVDALNGRPGVISSHFATDGKETGLTRVQRDEQNNQRLLKELADIPEARRSARFVCVMVLANPEKVITTTRGTFEGRIGLPRAVPRGTNGFGYDPLFLVAPDYSLTGAELSPEVKNQRSHRAGACKAMAEWIRGAGPDVGRTG